MWPSSSTSRHIGLPPEFFFVAPASSFQPHHHHHHDSSSAAANNFDPSSLNPSIGVGVIPLLTATPLLPQSDEDVITAARSRGAVQFWHQNQPQSYSKKQMVLDHHHHDHNDQPQQQQQFAPSSTNNNNNNNNNNSSSSLGTATCQDCGNQAKKDCTHRRCRTCCKSRGFNCSTHVKSTWVPAARRRERQLIGGPSTGAAGSSQSTSSAKKPRLAGTSQTTSHTSTSNTTPPRSFDASSTHRQDASFKESLPGQVRAPATFKCVRVTALDDGEDEYAYQAMVNIGGHVFKGFLYDQGVEGKDVFPNISELHLGGGGRNGASSSSPGMDPSDMYGGSGGGLIGGSNYGNQIS